MTGWIFQGNRTRYDLDTALATSRLHSWRTPRYRYRDRTAAGDRVPPLLRVELMATAELASFRPLRGFQGSTVPLPADIAAALQERAAPRLESLGPMPQPTGTSVPGPADSDDKDRGQPDGRAG